MKTWKALGREEIQKAYFNYWRLQNIPAFIKFFDKARKREQAGKGRIYYPAKQPRETHTEWIGRVGSGISERWSWADDKLKKFGLHFLFVDPYKKIDWKALKDGRPDSEILDCYQDSKLNRRSDTKHRGFSPVLSVQNLPKSTSEYRKALLKSPFVDIRLDLRFDKDEILSAVSTKIEFYKAIKRLSTKETRDHFKKFPLCGEVWDLRKGFPKKNFREIARDLRRPTPTVISQYNRALELINGKPYKPGDHKAVMRSLIRKTTCKDCPEATACKIPCPDVQIQLKELEISQAHKLDRLFFDRQGEKKSTYGLAADREAYRRWLQESH